MHFDRTSNAQQAVSFYCDLSGISEGSLKYVSSPALPESNMTDEEAEQSGVLQNDAAKTLMRLLWLSRLSRPDLAFIVCRLASNVSQWSKPKSSPRPRYWKDLTATDLQQLELRVVEGQATLVGARAVISWDHHQVLDTFRISAKKVVKASIGKCVGHFLW